MDMSKPVGDACCEDGTLKDASEMEWPDSPTGNNHSLLTGQYEDLSWSGPACHPHTMKLIVNQATENASAWHQKNQTQNLMGL